MKQIAMLVAATVFFGWSLIGQAQPERPERYSFHLVQPGDTLWSIARQYMPETDPRVGVEWIKEVNRLEDAMIRPGDVLNVPCADGVLEEPLGPEYSSIEAAEMAERELQRLFSR